MQYFAALDSSIVALTERLQNLHEYFPDHIFSHEILLRFTLFDQLGHVPIIAVLHDDIDLPLIFDLNSLLVPHDIWMIKPLKTVDLADDLRPLLVGKMAIIYLFPAVEFGSLSLIGRYPLNLRHGSIAAFSDFFNYFVLFHFLKKDGDQIINI